MIKFIKKIGNWISWVCYQMLFWFRFKVLDTKITFLIVGLAIGATSLNLFYQTEQIKALLLFQGETKTIIINQANAASKPEAVIQDNNALANYLADLIYHKESSNGLNDDKCERLGPNSHNGYGFKQGIGKNYCLSSDSVMRELVIVRLKELIAQDLSDNEILCVYNTGSADTATKDCQAYLNI